MRLSPERDVSSLRAFDPGGGQISRAVRVSARALLDVLGGKQHFASAKQYFEEKCPPPPPRLRTLETRLRTLETRLQTSILRGDLIFEGVNM